MILEIKRTFKAIQHLMYLILLRKISVFRRNAPIDSERIIQYRDINISLRAIEAINASHASIHNCSSSRHFKEECISLTEPIQSRKKSKKIFCCFNIKLYFCTHEREITKSYRSYYTDTPIHYITSHIGSLHPYSLAVQDYPKIFSAINLAGNSKPAIT